MTALISTSNKSFATSVIAWLVLAFTPFVSALEERHSSSPAEDQFWVTTVLVVGILSALAVSFHYLTRYESRVRCQAILTHEEQDVRDQTMFLHQRAFFAWVKNHVFYAPLFHKRHSREIRLFGIASGIFPLRLDVFCIAMVYLANILYIVVGPPGKASEKLSASIVSVRCGGLATANLVPLLLMSARHNPLTLVTGITFDKWNMGHRWIGRMIAVEAILHVVYFSKKVIPVEGKEAFRKMIIGGKFQGAFIALLMFCALSVHSIAILRHAFYETFHHLHVCLVITAFALIYKHTEMSPIAHVYLQIAIALWIADRASRLAMLVYRNVGGSRLSKVDAEILPGECVRLNININRPWNFRPGQYAFITLPSIGIYMSHPFSVSWCTYEPLPVNHNQGQLEEGEYELDLYKQHPRAEHMIPKGPAKVTSMSMLVRRRNGFTDSLYRRVLEANGHLSLHAYVTGPYGAPQCYDSYGSVLLIAAGVGISHIIPYVRHLTAGHAQGTIATGRIRLVWIVRSTEHIDWIGPWMRAILDIPRRREVLHVSVFVTHPQTTTRPIHSTTVRLVPGKPNLKAIFSEEIEYQIGALMVSVCGTGSLADDVRQACRKIQKKSRVDFVEETFSW